MLGPWQIMKFMLLMTLPKFLVRYVGFSFFDKVSMNFFADVVRKTILARESLGGQKREDFLQLMLDAKSGKLDQDDDDKGQGAEKKAKLTEDLILAQCVLFFIAGFDTTESLLIFAAYELAINPEVQEKLYEEVNETLENNGGKLTYDLVNKMPYLEMVISETLRKYPPAVRLDRRVVTSSYKVPGTEVTWDKDTVAVIPVFAIHHDESIYPNPEKFIPERFSAEEKAGRHPYTYLPFGLGPRSCIAMRFALVEAKTAIAHLVHSFRLEPSAKTPIPVTFLRGTTLKPTGGMWLNVKSRN
jgi:cytochrome P450